MSTDVIVVQIILGIILFFIINWIGKHSYSIGYISISIFVRSEEAPAYNFLIRILTPVVYIIIAATIFYTLNLDKYVANLYFVNIYYIVFRLVFNLSTGRGLLLNWYRQVIYWASIIVLSYLVYDKIIASKTNILPDFTTVANELWIIILIFLYQIANKIEIPQEGTVRRKNYYLEKTYYKFKELYGHIIEERLPHDRLKTLAYSILIYENFNRPKLARFIENLRFKLTNKPHTLGVMQVHSNKFINDEESVELGVDKIYNSFNNRIEKYLADEEREYHSEWQLIDEIIADYNSGVDYLLGINELQTLIEEKIYNNRVKGIFESEEAYQPNATVEKP